MTGSAIPAGALARINDEVAYADSKLLVVTAAAEFTGSRSGPADALTPADFSGPIPGIPSGLGFPQGSEGSGASSGDEVLDSLFADVGEMAALAGLGRDDPPS